MAGITSIQKQACRFVLLHFQRRSPYRYDYTKEDIMANSDRITASRKIDIKLEYVKELRIESCNIHNYTNKSLVVDFHKPLYVLSTLEGYRINVATIGNHYASVTLWAALQNEIILVLRERKISIGDELSFEDCECGITKTS